jgi:hypothetical protein
VHPEILHDLRRSLGREEGPVYEMTTPGAIRAVQRGLIGKRSVEKAEEARGKSGTMLR